ncbi:hypothetical protein VMCG_08093 [Cytospora schulzeri]|uniref:Uncharacterized protein n=1 Tax=Cytospora schulzeri TaxID=448051 RepID=A0A423VRJ1_9PEZI|nr:hypothetical protein VMCG_08093 [Valsa malicola]
MRKHLHLFTEEHIIASLLTSNPVFSLPEDDSKDPISLSKFFYIPIYRFLETMKDQRPFDAPERSGADGKMSINKMWAEAAKEFESICGESLQRGELKTFDDVQKKIEGKSKSSGSIDEGEDRWDKAKSVGLKSLKYLKMLVGAASQASGIIPIPASATNMASSALCFVFDIPKAIQGYNDAIDQVFSEVSSALSQFKIYQSIENVNPSLVEQIHSVMVSFVRLCAHVVTYRQGRKRDRFRQKLKSIFDEDSGLSKARDDFMQALQQQRDMEGTITLAVVIETRHDIARLLERFIVFNKSAEETQKGVQSLKEDADRTKILGNIRDTLSVPWTVRLDTNTTQTCINIHSKCLEGTGSWIWTHNQYLTWMAPKDKDTSNVLIMSGPPSSGKTSASALITKRLEEHKERTYVAHYFFPASIKKSDDEKNPVQSALKYMAFQIARVDPTVRKALGKACDAGFRGSSSLETLWGELKIGAPGSGATYYLVFDGIENLPDKQTEILLRFILSAGVSRGSVRVLASGTDDAFANESAAKGALRIQMEEHNESDMRIYIDEALNSRGMLQHAKPNSDQKRAREKVVGKLPQKAKGSYYLLQFELEDVFRMLSTRTAVNELDRMLEQSTSSHEVAIKQLQRSLGTEEIRELNELLKWVLFTDNSMNLDELEAAMFLYSGSESLASLQYIIKTKYSAVLKLEDDYVHGQDGVMDYLQKDKDASGKSSHPKERATISMSININNVDQELCGHFFWDLAHKVIRDKFKFDFDAATNALHNSQAVIAVDEFEAHHTIVTRAFEYLEQEPRDQTKAIGAYLGGWLPYHLGRLRQLEDEEKGSLMPDERLEIGRNLYKLFKDVEVFRRYRSSFEQCYWLVEEMEHVQKWLMDSAVVRRLDKKWRDEVQRATSPTKGYLRGFGKMVVEGLLRERSWGVEYAYNWIRQFMIADRRQPQNVKLDDGSSTSFASDTNDIDWDDVSSWCQDYLGLSDSELDSLWYERLAKAAYSQSSETEIVISLYKRALKKAKPSWLCHRGLGETHFDQDQIPEAILEVELALKEAKGEGAAPKPEENDIVDMHLLLGDYAYKAAYFEKSAEHYILVCKRATRTLLQSTLAGEDGTGRMVSVLKMAARDYDHDAIFSKMFSVAKGDPTLLREIVRAMETATVKSAPDEDYKHEDDRYAEDESRGVLLYYRGVAAYTYNVPPEGTNPISEALKLWMECREQLSDVGGFNSFVTRQAATTDLAKHYFQSMLDSQKLDHVDELSKLANSSIDPDGFLGALYALRGEEAQSKAVLLSRMKDALQILSDDIPENDIIGFIQVFNTLSQYHDFTNAAIALSMMGQQDLVTEALSFEAEDIIEDDFVDKQPVLDMVTKLANKIIKVAKTQVPDSSRQIQRIEAAKLHIDTLLASTKIKSEMVEIGDNETKESVGHIDDEPTVPVPQVAIAHRLLHTRLSALQQKHTPKVDVPRSSRFCDGRTADGKHCKNRADFENDFYHCIYCSNRDFCGDCLKRLCDPKSCTDITACNSKHRWLKIPPLGRDMYVGLWAKSVQVPSEVRPMNGDRRVLEICYAKDGIGQDVTVEAWKQAIAKEWDISLETEEGTTHEGYEGDDEDREEKNGERKSEETRQVDGN